MITLRMPLVEYELDSNGFKTTHYEIVNNVSFYPSSVVVLPHSIEKHWTVIIIEGIEYVVPLVKAEVDRRILTAMKAILLSN